MDFFTYSQYLEELESKSSKNEMVAKLAELILELEPGELPSSIYLLLGQLGPMYRTILFNMSDKLVMRALANIVEKDEKELSSLLKEIGDVGDLAYKLLPQESGVKLSVGSVYEQLLQIAKTEGVGSVKQKVQLTGRLLKVVSAQEAKYIVRIILDRLRVGFAEATVMDALSWAKTESKTDRRSIEDTFNVYPDIGKIAEKYMHGGVTALRGISIEPGVPIRPAQSERLANPEAIVAKLVRFAVEPKMDGFRAQVHVWGEGRNRLAKVFSRNLNETTHMFPEIIEAAKQLPVDTAIFDSEAIAYNPDTYEFLPFQETVKRRRKHGVNEASVQVPLKAFAFDLLYLNGESLLNLPAEERFLRLRQIGYPKNGVLLPSRQVIVSDTKSLHALFSQYVSEGLEGVMCKKLDAEYQAGSRNFNWVKYKRAHDQELTDTVDAVIMGYYKGKGQRTVFGIGAFLVGIYDPLEEKFQTIAKVGTGLTDHEWRTLRDQLDKYLVSEMPAEYEVNMTLFPDVWVLPRLVVEISADEITRSPLHSARAREDSLAGGLALRFPRFERIRSDKLVADVTTTSELASMFEAQRSK